MRYWECVSPKITVSANSYRPIFRSDFGRLLLGLVLWDLSDAFANVDGVWKRCGDVVDENTEFKYTRSIRFERSSVNNVRLA